MGFGLVWVGAGAWAAAGAALGWGRAEGAAVVCLLVFAISRSAYVSGTLGAAGCCGAGASCSKAQRYSHQQFIYLF